jgi:hypothetical protein
MSERALTLSSDDLEEHTCDSSIEVTPYTRPVPIADIIRGAAQDAVHVC